MGTKSRNVQFSIPQGSDLGPALDALQARFSGLKPAVVWRKIFELGMPVLASNPDLVRTDTTPSPDRMTEEYWRQARSTETPPPQKRPTTAERTSAGLDATGSSKSLNEVRGHLEALREEKREREEGEAPIVRMPPTKPTTRPPRGAPKDRTRGGRTGSRGSEE